MTRHQHHAELRAWAKGIYTDEAAVELLIQFADGRFAGTHNEWIEVDGHGRFWVNWEELLAFARSGIPSGGERRVLQIAASLGGASYGEVPLKQVTAGLGIREIELVLAAMSHAMGAHDRHPDPFLFPDGPQGPPVMNPDRHLKLGPLFPWPEEPEPPGTYGEYHVDDTGVMRGPVPE